MHNYAADRVGLPGPQILAFVKFYLQIYYILSAYFLLRADYILYTILYTIRICKFYLYTNFTRAQISGPVKFL